MCIDGTIVMDADYVAQPCYYNKSDYYDCDWQWARISQSWNTTGLIQGINTVYFAGTDGSANYTTGQAQFLYDTVPPYASNVSITNITSTGYDVYVYGVGDTTSGVAAVKFPTWTKPDQSDIRWDTGTNLGGGTWYYHVSKSSWNNAVNNYATHVYVYDNAGNSAFAGGYGSISLITTDLQISYLPPNSNYRANTDVVTSFTVGNIGETDILPSSNLSVSFSAYYLNGTNPVYIVNTTKSGIVVPANNNTLVYFKWHGYFGNMKGYNAFRNITKMGQIGFNRYTDLAYYLTFCSCNSRAYEILKDKTESETINYFDLLFKNGGISSKLREIMYRSIVADFEQNFFRFAIRNYNNTSPIEVWTFCNTSFNTYKELFEMLEKRFIPLGVIFEYENNAIEIKTEKVKVRTAPEGKVINNTQKVLEWTESQQIGRKFKTSDVLQETGLNSKQFQKTKECTPIKIFFDKNKTNKQGYYEIV
jgi:hypothetical protein